MNALKRGAALQLAALAALAVAASAPAVADPLTAMANRAQARNVILMIGDGMGETHLLATRLFYKGRDGRLEMETLPVYNQVNTFSEISALTDSAAAATAFATGVRTNIGTIAQDPAGNSTLDKSLLILARDAGKSTGLITDVTITHATPAPFAASVAHRSMANDIAQQYLENRVDVLLGGGENNFLPTGTAGRHCPVGQARRTDGRNLIDEAALANYEVVGDQAGLAAATAPRGKLLGLFACGGLDSLRVTDLYSPGSPSTEYGPGVPTLAQKTTKALEILNRNRRGFFLMVEQGKIDRAAEANDLAGTIAETKSYDDAVAVARAFVERNPNTLLVVTSDHETGGMSIVFGIRNDLMTYERGSGRLQVLPPVVPRPTTVEVPRDSFGTQDGQTAWVRWATLRGHTAVPVGVRAAGACTRGIRRMNGSGHHQDLYQVMRGCLLGARTPRS